MEDKTLKKWKPMKKHPLKKKDELHSLYVINKRKGICMEQKIIKESIRRFSKVMISLKEMKLLKSIKLIK